MEEKKFQWKMSEEEILKKIIWFVVISIYLIMGFLANFCIFAVSTSFFHPTSEVDGWVILFYFPIGIVIYGLGLIIGIIAIIFRKDRKSKVNMGIGFILIYFIIPVIVILLSRGGG